MLENEGLTLVQWLVFYSCIVRDYIYILPNWSPCRVNISYSNGNLRACGQIAAASLSQGGPPPDFLDERVFTVMLAPDIDLTDMNIDRYLTEDDLNYIKSLLVDIPLNANTIIDHGYTGPINVLKKMK